MSECALVLALDPGGRAPRVVDADAVQAQIDALVAEGVAPAVARDKAVGALGTLRCTHRDEMIFRRRGLTQRGVRRRPHFAHKHDHAAAHGNPRAPCPCGMQRGGRGWLHLRAQELLVAHIAELQFVQWCPRRVHQLRLAGNPRWTAQLEASTRNADDRRISLDVAVYDEHHRRALGIEVTHTHRVSWESRRGVPYVDVGAQATVDMLESGGRVLVCTTGVAGAACRRCALQFLRKWFVVARRRRIWAKRALFNAWVMRTRRLRREEAARARREEAAARMCARVRAGRRAARLRGAWRAWSHLKLARRRRVCAVFVDAGARRVAAVRDAWGVWTAETRRRRQAERAQAARAARKRQVCRTFMATSRAHQTALGAAKGGGAAGGKSRGRWESHAQRERRQLRAHNAAMERALEQSLASAASATSATSATAPAVCQECAWTGGRLGKARTDGGESLHWEQCTTCLRAMQRQGWGQEDTFDAEDDTAICRLLNAYGMPCTAAGTPARLHFHRSVLHFHRRFGRTKRWSALVAHLHAHFTTTMSCPSPTLFPDYRGWYVTYGKA